MYMLHNLLPAQNAKLTTVNPGVRNFSYPYILILGVQIAKNCKRKSCSAAVFYHLTARLHNSSIVIIRA